MRTYLILRDKAARWNADKEIQGILEEINAAPKGLLKTAKYSKSKANALLGHVFDKDAMTKKRLPYERLDQLTIDVLTGTR
jgi:xylose isomerase